MTTYARIDNGAVAEIITTDRPIKDLFHPSLNWVEATGPGTAVGWLETAEGLVPPLEPAPPAMAAAPDLATLQTQLAALAAQVAALAAQ